MKFLLMFTLIILVLIFGLSSMSQSYAAARQAQAAIEASQTAQIASAGNLAAIVTLIILLAAALVVIAYLLLREKQTKPRPAKTNSIPASQEMDLNSLLPAMVTMMLLQTLQNQHRPEPDSLFRARYEEDLTLPDENDILWTI